MYDLKTVTPASEITADSMRGGGDGEGRGAGDRELIVWREQERGREKELHSFESSSVLDTTHIKTVYK